MSIDIRFLQQLPAPFVREQEDLNTLQEIDADRNFAITPEEAQGFLRRLAERDDRPLNENDIPQITQDFMGQLGQTADAVRQVIETRRVSLAAFLQRNPQTHTPLDQNHDGTVNAEEMQHALLQENPDLLPLEVKILIEGLQLSAYGLYQDDLYHQCRGVPRLINAVTYIPVNLLHPVEAWQTLTDRNEDGHWWECNPRTRSTTNYTWRRLIIETADVRRDRRQIAIHHFDEAWREHPDEEIPSLLGRLSAEDREILVTRLHLYRWMGIAGESTPLGRARLMRNLAEHSREGHWNSSILASWAGLLEFFTTPWRDNNYYTARSLLNALENDQTLPSSLRDEARAARIDSEGSSASWWSRAFWQNLPDELTHFNGIWDTTVRLAVEILATRGIFRAANLGRGALAAWLAGRGVWGARLALILGHTATATAETVSANPARTLFTSLRELGRGALHYGGRGLYRLTQGAMVVAAHHFVQSPGRAVNHQIDSSLRLYLPEGDERPSRAEFNQLVLVNLVNLRLHTHTR